MGCTTRLVGRPAADRSLARLAGREQARHFSARLPRPHGHRARHRTWTWTAHRRSLRTRRHCRVRRTLPAPSVSSSGAQHKLNTAARRHKLWTLAIRSWVAEQNREEDVPDQFSPLAPRIARLFPLLACEQKPNATQMWSTRLSVADPSVYVTRSRPD